MMTTAFEREIRRHAKAELARRYLLDFTRYTMPTYETNWHHERVAHELDAFARGETKRLIICEPPRHGKSEQVSRRLPAFLLGQYPDASIIACSYGADLAQRMNRDVQRIIDDPLYGEVFRETRLHGSGARASSEGSYLRNSDIFEVVGRKGVYKCAGVGGSITGMGFDFGIIDDPFKNAESANSPTIRDAVWEWYTSTFYTRAERNASILLTLTRWHEDDLAGRLLRLQESDPSADQWRVVKLPALFDANVSYRYEHDPRSDGEPLWPGKYDMTKLETIKATLGSYQFNALYQQSPAPLEGGLFQRGWWKYWRELPAEFDEIAQSWDCTFKGSDTSDYVVGQVWGKIGAEKYLIDQVRGHMTFTETLQAFRSLSQKWPAAHLKLVEDAANGAAVIDTLKNEIGGIVPVTPQGGKVARAQAASPSVEAGNVYIPTNAPWVGDFVEETAAFPNAAHDDQVDAMTQMLARWQAHSTSWDITT